METGMDKFQLKDKLIETLDKVEELASNLERTWVVNDGETGVLRQRSINALAKAYETIEGIMQSIY